MLLVRLKPGKFPHIVHADSRYVELLQVADWITGSVKEKFFTHPERDYGALFDVIHAVQIGIPGDHSD
jgi:hypothetical protein